LAHKLYSAECKVWDIRGKLDNVNNEIKEVKKMIHYVEEAAARVVQK
jgi:hypothetical protein